MANNTIDKEQIEEGIFLNLPLDATGDVIGGTGPNYNKLTLPAIPGLVAGSYTNANITVDNKGRVTLASSGASTAGMTWTTVTGATTMAAENGYFANSASLITFTLPVTITKGDRLAIIGQGLGGWRVSIGPGQSVRIGKNVVTGPAFLSSTHYTDVLYLQTVVDNTTFAAYTLQGNPGGYNSVNNELTFPKITTGIKDTNTNTIVEFSPAASAVNNVQLVNAATGGAVAINAAGSDANVPLSLKAKGTSKVNIGTANLKFPNVDGTAGQVLSTDGFTNLSWATIGTGTVQPGLAGRLAIYPADGEEVNDLPLGTANQVLGMNNGATAHEYKTINGTADRLTVTHATNLVTLDVGTNVIVSTGTYSDPAWIDSLDGAKIAGDIPGNAQNVNGVVAIANGGSGQSTANDALNAFLPAQAGNAGEFLSTDGTDTLWTTALTMAVTDLNGQTAAVQTFANDTNVTITSASNVHTLGWTGELSLARGGTGASLADPGADRILFWDDSAGTSEWLALGTNLSISGTTLNASAGAGGYTEIQEEGVPLTARSKINFVGGGITAADDGVNLRTNVSLDSTLNALSSYNTNGLITQTSNDNFTGRSIAAGSTKISVVNGSGVSGNPTIDVVEGNLNLASMGGILPITKGGTGASTSTAAINALLPGQSGNVGEYLQTDGTNISWAPISIGAAGTLGQVQFNDGAGNLAADSQFYWDNINKRLGVGGTPSHTFHVQSATDPKIVIENTDTGGAAWRIISANNAIHTIADGSLVFNDGTDNVLTLDSTNNRVGINTTTPSVDLDVAGDFTAQSINVNGTYTLPAADGTVNQVLKTDGSGTVTWQDDDLGTGEDNTASNVGVAGVGVFKQKTGVDLEFRGIDAANNKVTVTLNATDNDIEIGVQEANFTGIPQSAVTNLTTALTGKLDTTLTDTFIFVGNGSNVATGVAMSGDATIANTGAVTIANNVVSFAKMQDINTGRLLGRSTASTGDIEQISIGSGLLLSGGSLSATGTGIWQEVGGVFRQANTPAYDEDLVFGSPQLTDSTTTIHDRRLIFDKSEGAFAVGEVQSTQWDTLGLRVAIIGGLNNTANAGNNHVVIGGSTNSITSTDSDSAIVGGNNNSNTGNASVILGGDNNTANNLAGITYGEYATTQWDVASTHGFGDATYSGQKQEGGKLLQTANATPVSISGSLTSYFVVPANSSSIFEAKVIARQTAGTSGTVGDTAAWELKGVIKRDGAGNTTLVGSVSKTSIGEDTATSAWDVDITADDTNEAIEATVTGEANKTIEWAIFVESVTTF